MGNNFQSCYKVESDLYCNYKYYCEEYSVHGGTTLKKWVLAEKEKKWYEKKKYQGKEGYVKYWIENLNIY